MPLTAAERVRRHREKLKKDPDRFKEHKEKHAALVKSKTKKISDLSETEKEKQREKWRKQKRQQKENKKSSSALSSKQIVSKKNKPNKSTAILRKYKAALKRIQTLNTSLQTAKKKLYRLKKKNQHYEELVNKMKAREEILEISLKESFKKCKTQNQKRIIKSLGENESVIRAKKKTYVSKLLGLKGRIRKRKVTLKNDKISTELIKFFLRDDITRCTAGKRECRTEKGTKKKEQIRYLTDTLANLYKIYKSEGGIYSLSTFYKHKPFYILVPGIQNRDTCMCVKHANFELLLYALHKNKLLQYCKTEKDVISKISCDLKSYQCMNGQCEACKFLNLNYHLAEGQVNSDTNWMQWEREDHEYKKTQKGVNIIAVAKKTSKVLKKGTVGTLIKSFEDSIPIFKAHYYTWKHQQQKYRECINCLTKNEALILCDFSENYKTKLAKEIQSMHFGASKQQITLHTGVVYWKNDCQSFCSVADNNCHEPAAIWAHIIPVIKMIKRLKPETKIIHFYSDSTSSQYRQKKNFFLQNLFTSKLNLEYCTWSFTESGHGKGVADGIGGSVKRALDRHVSHGNDIRNGSQAHEVLTKVMKSVECFYIQDCDIENINKIIPKKLSVIIGTMKIHQIISTCQGKIQHRRYSCFCGEKKGLCGCFSPQDHSFQNTHATTTKKLQKTTKIITKGKKTTKIITKGNTKKNTAATLETNIKLSKQTIKLQETNTPKFDKINNITSITDYAKIDDNVSSPDKFTIVNADIHSTNTNPSKTDIHLLNTNSFKAHIHHSKPDSRNLDEIIEIFDGNLNSNLNVSPVVFIGEKNATLGSTLCPSPEVEFVYQFEKDFESADLYPLVFSDDPELNFVLKNTENILQSDPLTLRKEAQNKFQQYDLGTSAITSNKRCILADVDKYSTMPKKLCQTKTKPIIGQPVTKENIKVKGSKGLKTAVTRTLQCASCKVHMSPFRTKMTKCMACTKTICLKCSDGYTYFDYICANCLST